MSRYAARLLAALGLAAAAAGAFGRWQAAREAATRPHLNQDGRHYQDLARNLLRHGTLSLADPDERGPRPPAAERAPLFPAYLALAERSRPGAAWEAQGAAGAALAALGAAVGWLAAGPAGLAAAGVAALDARARVEAGSLDIQTFYGALIALVALTLLAWGRAPSPARAAAAGLAVGASLLARSTLAPFLLFLPAWLALARSTPARPRAHLAAFLAAALAPALAWPLRNAVLRGEWSFFERGQIEYLLPAGFSGAVSDDVSETPHAHAHPELSLERAQSGPRGALPALGRAAALAARDPVAAANGILTRTAFWGWGLLAWIPALLVLRRARRERLDLWALGALAVYWNLHLFIMASGRYFLPAMIPLAALAAAAFPGERPGERWSARACAGAAAAAAACVLLAWGAVARELSRRPAREGTPPRAAWRTLDAARAAQAAGRPDECARLLAAVVAAHPEAPRPAADLAICAELSGDRRGALAAARAAAAADPGYLPGALTLGALLERQGRRAEAVATYERALRARPGPPEEPLRAAVMRARAAAAGRQAATRTQPSPPR